MSEKIEHVHKITLGTGKVVLVRDMTLKHQELAMKAVGDKAGENKFLFVALMQRELIKVLIHSVGKDADSVAPVNPIELESLDRLFTVREFTQLGQVIDQLMGGNDLGEFQTEIVAIGSK